MVELNYTLTPEEVREMLFPPIDWAGHPVKKKGPFRRALGLVFLICMLGFWGLILLFSDHLTVVTGAPARPSVPEDLDNLWLYLVPGLMPVLLLVLLSMFGGAVGRAKGNPKKKRALSQALSISTMVVLIGGMFLMGSSGAAVAWGPTRSKVLGVAFAPWLALFVWMAVRGMGEQRRKARAAWDSKPSLRRAKTVRASEESFCLSDEFAEAVYQWPIFKRYAETPNLLLLTFEGGESIGVPKRAIQSEADHLTLRRLLYERIGAGTFLPAQAGFSVIPQPVELVE